MMDDLLKFFFVSELRPATGRQPASLISGGLSGCVYTCMFQTLVCERKSGKWRRERLTEDMRKGDKSRLWTCGTGVKQILLQVCLLLFYYDYNRGSTDIVFSS